MRSLVEQLRELEPSNSLSEDAADRIEELEAALREIAKGLPESGSIYEMVTIARTALAPEQDKCE